MILPLTLETNPLATGMSLPPEAFIELIYRGGKQPAYSREIVNEIAVAIDKYSRLFSDDGRSVGGQIIHETDYLRFTGDVDAEQFNFGGLGATGGGVKGESYSTPDEGVLAVFAHRSIYLRGTKDHWDASIRPYYNASKRYDIAVSAGKAGIVHKLGDFGNGNWAVGSSYANAIVTIGNMFKLEGVIQRVLKLAIGAGHHNTSGGNAEEIALTGPLTKVYVDTARRLGVDVRCYTPNDGLGMYPGPLHAAVNTVNQWADAGWVPDMLVEVHYQGLTEGSDAGKGFFTIYPDWNDDIDRDVLTKFIPAWVPEYQIRTGMLPYGNGGMSEKRTAVGASGYRLGVFSETVGLKAYTTRMIIEHGCHTCPSDHRLIVGPEYNQQVVDAFFAAWFKMEGLPFPTPAEPEPPKPYVPSGYGEAIPNQWNNHMFYLIGPFYKTYKNLGENFLPTYGLLTSGMVVAPVNGIDRYVQFTERGCMACYPIGLPHGVAEDNPMFIRNLFPHEREEALASAKARGLVYPDLV